MWEGNTLDMLRVAVQLFCNGLGKNSHSSWTTMWSSRMLGEDAAEHDNSILAAWTILERDAFPDPILVSLTRSYLQNSLGWIAPVFHLSIYLRQKKSLAFEINYMATWVVICCKSSWKMEPTLICHWSFWCLLWQSYLQFQARYLF